MSSYLLSRFSFCKTEENNFPGSARGRAEEERVRKMFGICVRLLAAYGCGFISIVALRVATSGWPGAYLLFVASATGVALLTINLSNYVGW